MGEYFTFNFLIKENNISKDGYHNRLTIKKGDKFLFSEYNLINKNPTNADNKYIPPSPKYNLLQILNINKVINKIKTKINKLLY